MLATSSIPTLALSLGTLTQLGFFIMLLVYTLFTAVLYYHWHNYADNRSVTRITFILYFLITLPFLGVMGITAYSF